MGKTRRGAVAALAACTVVAAAGVTVGVSGIARAATTTPVPGSADPAVHAASDAGAVPASQQLTVQVWLKPNVAGATAFANAVAAPGSAGFHRYLSPDAYTARFGPSAAQATAITAWLTTEGLTRVHADSGRDYVSATGPASRVESVFQVRINRYRVKGPNGKLMVIQANDRPVSIPATLAPGVLGVTGLISAPPAASQAAATPSPVPRTPGAKAPACAEYWAQHVQTIRPAYQGLTKASLPVCGYTAGQIRAAYGATWTDTGRGQTVALAEEDDAPLAWFQTLTDYARSNHLPAPKSARFRERDIQAAGSCGSSSPSTAQQPGADFEPQMDSEAVYALAPGASQLLVNAVGCNPDQDLLDADLAVLTGDGDHPSASIVSNSWVIPIGDMAPQIVHAVDLRAAAEGVGMYFAAGDVPGLNMTDSDPYSIAVGGTTLGIGAKNNRVFETGWSDDFASLDDGHWTDYGINDAGGGGTSLVYGQPSYQRGVVPASMSHVRVGKRVVTDRAVPDLAADADTDTGMLIGYIKAGTNGKPGPYQTSPSAGTSLACPLIAALVADAQQGQRSAFGFINPLIYRLAGTRAFRDILPVTTSMPQQDRAAYLPGSGPGLDVFDSQKRAGTRQVTAKGYDTMTGIGTPNGAAFIAALRRAGR